MVIKTFRGQMVADAQDTIVLHTNDGRTGYRIVKFQILPRDIGTQAGEHVVQIWKVEQTSISAGIDFSDNTLLAAAVFLHEANTYYPHDFYSIFDQEIFNQDIYITHTDTQSNVVNYYIELEQVDLDLNESTVATLKDIRNT